VAAEEGHLLGEASTLVDGNDGECASAARFPIDRDVFGIGLDQVRVPCVLGYAEVIVTLLL
jgi:hypothetical protein